MESRIEWLLDENGWTGQTVDLRKRSI